MKNQLEKEFNFGIVIGGKLYRSSQPNNEFLEYLKKQYGIKTVIVLRTNVNAEEREFCQKNDIHLVQLPMKSWRRWPEPEEVQWFLNLLGDSKSYPVLPTLIHCWEGKDRTSAMIALYRLGCQKWTLKEAVREMKLWKANWFWRLYIQTSASRVLAGFKERNIFLIYLKRFLNLIFGLEGLAYAIKHEKNLQLFLIAEMILLGIAFWRGVSMTEFIILLLACGVFDTLEIFNSAVERLADLAQPQFDPRVKIIKDLLSGGMIFVGVTVLIIWAIAVFF